MKKLNNIRIKELVLLFTIIIFALLYWQTVMYLPLFGDATIHGGDAKILLKHGVLSMNTDYPSLYYFSMASLFSIFGEKGFNFFPYIGILFLLISAFLLTKKLTNNFYISLFSILLVGSSPKLIYYASRMYQEIVLSAFFIFSIFLLFKYLGDRKNKTLLILLFFTGITISIKQQGLFVLYPSLFLFFLVEYITKKIKFKTLLMIIIIPLIITLPFYGILFHTKGELVPGSDEFKPFRIINNIGKFVFFYPNVTDKSNVSKTNTNLENKLNIIDERYSKLANTRAEDRHIWPQDVFINFEKFNEANNLYLLTWRGKELKSPIIFYFTFFFLLFGFLFCIIKYKQFSALLTFTFIFVLNNYAVFIRNNDQQRYHIFLPIYLTVFISLFTKFIFERSKLNKYNTILLSIFIPIILFSSILVEQIQANKGWANSQLYSPSIGGIKSVKEMGDWIKNNTNPKAILGQQCGNETEYYSDRQVIGDWKIDFLNTSGINEYLQQNNISYYVIYDSQIKPDENWNATCWIPDSFYFKIDNKYKKVFQTKKNDIKVYKVN